jgi:outer membrane protein TolC
MKNYYFVLFAIMFSSSVLASTHLNLDQMKDIVMDDNIEVALAYENYIEAKETAKVRTLELLPSLNPDIFLYDYQYTILRSIIPEPYRFLDAKAAKEMAKAAKVNQRVVQKNMILDLEKTFYIMNLNRELLSSIKKEQKIREEIKSRALESYSLGGMSFTSYNGYLRDAIKADTSVINTIELIDAEDLSLKLILGFDDMSEEITLAYPKFNNGEFFFPADVNKAADLAVERSFELKQYDYLIEAAKYRKDSEAISWLSWAGIGFDYPARVRVAKSNIRQVRLEKKQAEIQIRNQVASLYALIDRIQQKTKNYLTLAEIAEKNELNAQRDYDNLLGDFITVQEAKLDSLLVKRQLLSLKYEKEILLIRLKRVIGINMLAHPEDQVEMTQANLLW